MKNFFEKWSSWELWPHKFRYFFISPIWFWYCLRAGHLWFFTPSNPTLTFGGFEGESKKEMYEQLPKDSYPKTIYIEPGNRFDDIKSMLSHATINYPFIVKPDVGMSGILFRKIEKEEQLLEYHKLMPVDYIIQDLIHHPVEFSVFYYRFPYQTKGVITGFLQKEPLAVRGNGNDTLLQLIHHHSKAKHRLEELINWHRESLEKIIPNGEKYYLTHAANLSRGGTFINLHHEIDEDLCNVFDKLNHESKYFFYGRYDLKANSLSDLKKGINFLILEYNGSGAEPNHIYNSGYTLLGAYKEILKHWKILYKISNYNRKQGLKPWSLWKGWQYLKKSKEHFRLLKKLDTV
ncbi:MAG: hypothetical protein ABR503_09700 [Chitinophagaceae bacterium]